MKKHKFDNIKKFYTIPMSLILLVIILLGNVVSVISVTNIITNQNRNISDTSTQHLESIKHANSLRHGSDILTDAIKSFGATLDKAYAELFLTETFEIKSRDQSLDEIFKLNLLDYHHEHVLAAKDASDALLERELWAMRLIYEGCGYFPLPDTLVHVQLSVQEQAMSNEDKILTAQKFIFKNEYNEMKAAVIANLELFHDSLITCQEDTIVMSLSQSNKAITAQSITNIVGVILLFLVLASLYHFLVKPIRNYSEKLSASSDDNTNVCLKPYGFAETRTLATAYNRNMKLIESTKKQILEMNNELVRLNDTDYLTQIPNRQYIFKYINTLLGDTENASKVAVAIFDLDHFKKLNDTYGHPAGDKVLQAVAAVSTKSMQPYNATVSRIGGEEFMIAIPSIDTDELHMAMEQLLVDIENMQVEIDEHTSISTTVSIGSFCNEVLFSSIESIYPCVDKALYVAKQSGRNRHKNVDVRM